MRRIRNIRDNVNRTDMWDDQGAYGNSSFISVTGIINQDDDRQMEGQGKQVF